MYLDVQRLHKQSYEDGYQMGNAIPSQTALHDYAVKLRFLRRKSFEEGWSWQVKEDIYVDILRMCYRRKCSPPLFLLERDSGYLHHYFLRYLEGLEQVVKERET
ncbi:hypothetical protein P6P90_11885 [Ectobacillus antri]|jgi:hypothetical protein|uniref:DUF771 domain-containing protein n=1 Tax=Ectobacillus antri TaxID=2486280 RepID=A0ABT6H7C3_9BACI|nr:hypothetical protein [Ectobacillus antri]MDG4657661.1 hypothetical protein [Ectobacillus antri]MDG5754668.1 hypothetical protein [Ectobacillus antri]